MGLCLWGDSGVRDKHPALTPCCKCKPNFFHFLCFDHCCQSLSGLTGEGAKPGAKSCWEKGTFQWYHHPEAALATTEGQFLPIFGVKQPVPSWALPSGAAPTFGLTAMSIFIIYKPFYSILWKAPQDKNILQLVLWIFPLAGMWIMAIPSPEEPVGSLPGNSSSLHRFNTTLIAFSTQAQSCWELLWKSWEDQIQEKSFGIENFRIVSAPAFS